MTKVPAWIRVVREPLLHAEYVALTKCEGRIRGPSDVHKLLAQRAGEELQEVFWTVLLDSQSNVVDVAEVTRGTVNSSLVHAREVFGVAIAVRASGMVSAHNHPSGDPTPSADDRAVTRTLIDAGRLLDIPVYDHVIVTRERYVSFAETGLLP